VGDGSERVIGIEAECPERDGNFEHEEGGDHEREISEDVQPKGCLFAFDGGAAERNQCMGGRIRGRQARTHVGERMV
jgi:hypothetical protein